MAVLVYKSRIQRLQTGLYKLSPNSLFFNERLQEPNLAGMDKSIPATYISGVPIS